jgi:hypothetical protein
MDSLRNHLNQSLAILTYLCCYLAAAFIDLQIG